MNLLLAFAPFIVFAVVDRLIGSAEGMIAGAVVSGGLLVRDWLSAGHSPKILEIGTFILFGGLALYTFVAAPVWSIVGVRLVVDSGLLIIVLLSIALRTPFTLQYAREQVSRDLWDSPVFVRTNYVITAAWALAFAAMVVADLLMLYVPDIPRSVGIVITVLALVGAFKFTKSYPDRQRARAAR